MSVNHQLMAAGLDLAYGERQIVSALDITLPPGKLTVIVGANACGKSTLLRGLARLLPPRRGAVYLDGKPIHQLPTRDVATIIVVLPQSPRGLRTYLHDILEDASNDLAGAARIALQRALMH